MNSFQILQEIVDLAKKKTVQKQKSSSETPVLVLGRPVAIAGLEGDVEHTAGRGGTGRQCRGRHPAAAAQSVDV